MTRLIVTRLVMTLKERRMWRDVVSAAMLAMMVVTPAAAANEAKVAATGDDTAAAVEKNATPNTKPTPMIEEYRIGPEDQLQISIWKNDAMSKSVPVRPDGLISLPLLNDIQAAGLTAMELREVLMKRLGEYMPTPEVAVIVTEVRSYKVSVIGEVHKPGRYELKSWTTVLDLLAQAGGVNEFAARGRIVVLRPDGRTMKRIPFNYNRVISSSGGERENFYLRPGDILLVP
jgi:polysaccharide export outer membrane protein